MSVTPAEAKRRASSSVQGHSQQKSRSNLAAWGVQTHPQNVKSVPNYQGELTGNYVGVMCGALFGLIENCNINGCYYYGKDDDSLISGIVCGANHGSIVGVKIDGLDYGE